MLLLKMDFFGTQRTVMWIFHKQHMKIHFICCLVCFVVLWYLLFKFQMLICLLWIVCPFGTFSMLHFLLPFLHFFLSFRYFFKNLHSYSGCSSPLPPPQSSSACSSPWALVTSVNWFMGAVPIYWGCLISIVLKHFLNMSHLKVTLGPG